MRETIWCDVRETLASVSANTNDIITIYCFLCVECKLAMRISVRKRRRRRLMGSLDNFRLNRHGLEWANRKSFRIGKVKRCETDCISFEQIVECKRTVNNRHSCLTQNSTVNWLKWLIYCIFIQPLEFYGWLFPQWPNKELKIKLKSNGSKPVRVLVLRNFEITPTKETIDS